MIKHYKQSGKFSLFFIPYFIGVMLVVAPLLSFIYIYLTQYIPFVYANAMISVVVSCIFGSVLASYVVKKGKIRNIRVASILGFVGGSIFYYMTLCVWIDLIANSQTEHILGIFFGSFGALKSTTNFFEIVGIFLSPTIVFTVMKDINTVGTWAMHGSTVKGFFLYLIWAIEFLMITGISALCCMIQSEAPFSEEKLEWFKASKLNEMAFITDKAGFIKTLESGNEEDFKKYLQKRGEMKSHAYISLYTMVGVDKHYIDVSNYKYKGVKEEYTAVPVISKVEILYSFKKIIISTLGEKNKK